MSQTIDNLLKYQQVDEKLLAIEKEVTASQERKNYITTKNFLTQAPEKLDAYEAKAQRMEKQLQELIGSYNELAETTNDFNNIDDLIEEGADISFYKKNVMQIMDQLRNIKAEIANLQKSVASAGQEYQEFKKKTIQMQNLYNNEYQPTYKAYKAAKTEEMKVIKDQLDEIAKGIDPVAMKKYLEKRNERIFPVLCPIKVVNKEPRCSKCGMGFPISSLEKIKSGGVVECDYCRRILYTE
ncbi:MAG: hypothetical protein LUD50_02660 [Clostridia bacterium]|nr:hypothetical protein [Clostridia bacterium]